MGTVYGLTKDRMLAIEGASIVSGTIVGNNLILTKQNGGTVDAGNVRGPQGTIGVGYTPVEIPNAVSLNTYQTAGVYSQSTNAEAATGTNYPLPLAGLLEVFRNSLSDMVWQRYTIYGGGASSGLTFTRALYSSSWTTWQLLGPIPAPTVWGAVSADVSALANATFLTVPGWTYVAGLSTAASGLFTHSAGVLTATVAGVYVVSAAASITSSATGRRILAFNKNGTGAANEIMRTDVGSGGNATISVTATIPLAVNDTINFRVYQTSGGALALYNSPGHSLSILKVA